MRKKTPDEIKKSIEWQADNRMIERSKRKEPRKFQGLSFRAINTFHEREDCISYNEVEDYFDCGFRADVFGHEIGEDVTDEMVRQINNRSFGNKSLLRKNLSDIGQGCYLRQLLYFEKRHLTFGVMRAMDYGSISPN